MIEPAIDIEEIFSDILYDTMKSQLASLLRGKLEQAGAKVKQSELDRAAEQLVSGVSGPISFSSKKLDVFNIAITDDELKAITDRVEVQLKAIFPGVVRSVADQSARNLYETLKQRWKKEHKKQVADLARFRGNLEKRYGEGLDKLRMLVTIAREWGQENYQRKYEKEDGSLSSLDDVLVRLHVRACQVVLEIIILLENGLADGAMARWRTLHEITTVAMLIKQHGESLAERYVQYQIVESKKAMIAYEECREVLGYGSYPKKQSRKIAREYARVIATYGESFGGEYGWIAHLLGKGPKNRVTFADLQKAAEMKEMRAYYKMASYNVHASPKGVYFKLGEIEKSTTLPAGSTNAGLVEPAQNAAISFAKLTTLVCNDESGPMFDNHVFMKVIHRLMVEIPEDFARADKILKRDHFRNKRQTI